MKFIILWHLIQSVKKLAVVITCDFRHENDKDSSYRRIPFAELFSNLMLSGVSQFRDKYNNSVTIFKRKLTLIRLYFKSNTEITKISIIGYASS